MQEILISTGHVDKMELVISTTIIQTPLKKGDGRKIIESKVSDMEVDNWNINKMDRID